MQIGETLRQAATGARTAAKTVGALALLTTALPANAALTAAALVAGELAGVRDRAEPSTPVAGRRTVMISGGKMTKALQLARSFHAAGHRVILVEAEKYHLTGHRFSRAVDRFYTVPKPQDPAYAHALLEIVRAENVDVYVPVCSPVASRYDALARPLLSEFCEVVHCDAETIERLDDKAHFAAFAGTLGLRVPDTHRVTSPEQVLDVDHGDRRYVLKSIAYDPVNRLDLTLLPLATEAETLSFAASKPISPDNPWILQEFVEGTEYCTHSTARKGQLTVFCCCESSSFQLNYAHVDKPEIEKWVTTLVAELGATGQLSFDFIEDSRGAVYAIECNPRTHSAITMFYDQPALADAYLDDDAPTLLPTARSRPTYWFYNEAWKLLRHPQTAAERVRVVATGKDAIFDWRDPLPFLLEHHLQIPLLLLGNLRHNKPWIRIDVNIGKLVEPAGD